jgi:hypothetical protein
MNRVSAAAVVFGMLLASLWSELAFADARVALVIGNSAYQNAPALPNPIRDAQSMAAMLKKGGYTVVTANNVGNLQFKRAVREFEDLAVNADVAVVFYAGHGIEIGGANYMIPVDAKLLSDRDAEDEAITLDRLIASIEGVKQLGLVILDACRDNPFATKMKRRTVALRQVAAGLALVEAKARNTLIAYAAKSGFAAEDGDRDHSPFTAALLKHLFVPGRDIRFAFGYVRDDVWENTRHSQEPYVSGSLGGGHIALIAAPEQAAPMVNAQGQRDDFVLVQKLANDLPPDSAKRAWEAYVNQYPSGLYAHLAREQIDKLGGTSSAVLVTDGPRAPTRTPEGQQLAMVQPSRPPSPPAPSSQEQRAWDQIKDSSDAAALRDFIRRYPSSPLANIAQNRLDQLERAAREKAAEEARQKAEREAAARRAEEERQAKAAEEARLKAEQARAAAAEAARQRQAEAERRKAEQEAARQRAAVAEAERKRLADEEARKLREAADAARQKSEQEAARKRAEAAEAARQKAEQEAARKRAEEERRAVELAQQKADREASLKHAEEQRIAKKAEEEQQKAADRVAALQRAEDERKLKQQTACQREWDRLVELKAAKDQSKAREGLKRLEKELTCDGLRSNVTAALEEMKDKPEPVVQPTDKEEEPRSRRQRTKPERAKPEESRKSASRHKNEDAAPSRRSKREESRPAPRVRQEAKTAPVRSGGGGGGGGRSGGGAMVGVGF